MKRTVGVKLDEQMQERLKILGDLRRRSAHWIMKEAIQQYLEKEEAVERAKQETLERWQRYEATGEFISNDDVMAWLDSWGTDAEKPCPIPSA